MNLLEGKVALITGGSRGIGAAIVKTFVDAGASVAFTYLSSAHAAEQLIEGFKSNAKIKAYQSDASNTSEAEHLINKVIEDFGKLDILVNNAGITKDALLLRMSEQQWDDVMNTNLKSAFNLTKFAIKHMLRAGGSVINISSIVGVTGNAGQANYAASKAGMIGFTKSLAKELGGRNIRFNALAPGFIATEMTHELQDNAKEKWNERIPLQRAGTPNEVANATLFLASDYSSYITGQVLSVCGGLNI